MFLKYLQGIKIHVKDVLPSFRAEFKILCLLSGLCLGGGQKKSFATAIPLDWTSMKMKYEAVKCSVHISIKLNPNILQRIIQDKDKI